MAGEASFTIEESDYVAAHRAAYRALLTWKFVRIVAMLALIGFATMTAVEWAIDGASLSSALESGAILAVAIVVALGLIVGINLLKVPARARRLFRQNRLNRHPQTIAWDAREMRTTSARGSWSTTLADYHCWREGPGVFLLYPDDASFHLIPQRPLSGDQIADLRATLVEHGPPRR